MEQPILATEGGPALSLSSAGTSAGQHVLLRVPDCTVRMQAAASSTPSKRSLAALFGMLSAHVPAIFSGWSRPRRLVLCSLGLAMISAAVALAAATRKADANHAHSAKQADRLPVSGYAGSSNTWTTTAPTESAASVLDEAPPFKAESLGQVRPNQPGKVSGTAGSSATMTGAEPRKPTGPCAHIEQRIDRVPSQY